MSDPHTPDKHDEQKPIEAEIVEIPGEESSRSSPDEGAVVFWEERRQGIPPKTFYFELRSHGCGCQGCSCVGCLVILFGLMYLMYTLFFF